MARPSSCSPQLAELIFDRLAEGESLASICRDPSMPGLRTVLGWASRYAEFAAAYVVAREAAAEVLDDKINMIANSALDKDTAHAARVKIAALQWRASKQAPRKYGDRLGMEVEVDTRVDLADVIARRRQNVIEGKERPSREPDARELEQ
jgi:hypothetical protein